MYDDFDDDRSGGTRRLPPTWQLVVLAVGAGILVVGGVAAMVNHNRVARSNRLAVKYGLAASAKDATVATRCTAVLRNDYDKMSASVKAILPPGGLAVLAPKICAVGVQEGVVQDDGTMTRDNAEKVTVAAIQRMGRARVQTLIFNELAVTRYHLAKPGHVTRWDRCVAMGYSGYDGAEPRTASPSRAQFFEAVRNACATGIARGLVPPSGAPSRQDTAELLREALAKASK